MAHRIAWDIEEISLLIDAYLHVSSGEISRTEAVSHLSQLLRKKALDAGIEIDGIFRNENGISMQMKKIQYLFTGEEPSAFNNAPHLFAELVELCKSDWSSFNSILEKAKHTSELPKPTLPILENTSAEADNFYMWLTVSQGLAESTSRSYTSALNFADRFVKEHNIGSAQIWGERDSLIVKKTVDALFHNDKFITYNEEQHNRFSAAVKKYLQYLSEKAPISKTQSEDEDHLSFYNTILGECFPRGLRVQSTLDLKRFIRHYNRVFGTVHDGSSDVVRNKMKQKILQAGIRHGDYVFSVNHLVSPETEKRLRAYIEQEFTDGKNVLYYRTLFEKFNEEFLDQYIYDEDMLKTYLIHAYSDTYYFERSYMTQEENVQINPQEEIRNCMLTHVAPLKMDDLYERLPHIPRDRVRSEIHSNKEFIYNTVGEYFHVSSIDLSHDDLQNIVVIIEQMIETGRFISGNELIKAITSKHPTMLERFSLFSTVGLRNAIAYYLQDRFSFNGNIISPLEQQLSMYDIFAEFAKAHSHFTIAELNVLKNEMNCIIYFEAVYKYSLRISQEQFVSKEQASFDVSKTDTAIDHFCTGSYIPLREITNFGSFPYAGFPWNIYLLEHFVADFSTTYKLLHTSYNASSCVGAIVKRHSRIENFNDLIVDVLLHSGVDLNKKDALQYLYDMGYLARRRLSDIDQILIKARAQKGR